MPTWSSPATTRSSGPVCGAGSPTAPLELVAQSDTIAPGTGGVVFKQFANFHLTSTGLAAFGAFLEGAGFPEGVWSEAGGNGLQLVASTASQAPGTDPGVHFSDFGATFVNAAGHVAFPSALEGPGVETFENGYGVWSDAAGSGLALFGAFRLARPRHRRGRELSWIQYGGNQCGR